MITHPSATSLREPVTLELTFRRGVDEAPAGAIPLDRFGAEFPADMLPDVAAIEARVRNGDRLITITFLADRLSDEERTGIEVIAAKPAAGIVTRADARRACISWQNSR